MSQIRQNLGRYVMNQSNVDKNDLIKIPSTEKKTSSM